MGWMGGAGVEYQGLVALCHACPPNRPNFSYIWFWPMWLLWVSLVRLRRTRFMEETWKIIIIYYYYYYYYVTLHCVTSRHITSRHVTSRHITSHHIILYYIISYYSQTQCLKRGTSLVRLKDSFLPGHAHFPWLLSKWLQFEEMYQVQKVGKGEMVRKWRGMKERRDGNEWEDIGGMWNVARWSCNWNLWTRGNMLS